MKKKVSLEEFAIALTHSEWEIRLAALKELQHYNYGPVIPLLLKLLGDENEYIQRKTIEILAEYKDIQSVDPLLEMLTNESVFVRRQTIETLGQIGDVRAIDRIVAQLADEDGGVRIVARATLTLFPASVVVQRFTHIFAHPTEDQILGVITFALGPWDDKQLVPLLIPGLSNKNWRIRLMTVEALKKQNDVRSVIPLLTALQDENISVRCLVIEVLGQLEDERIISPLITQLSHPDERVRKATVQAMASFEHQDVQRAFTRVLTEDPAASVRFTLVNALKQWSNNATDLLTIALSDKDAEVRRCAIQAVGEKGDAIFIAKIIDSLSDDTVQIAAIEALGNIGNKRAIDPLLKLFFDREVEIEAKTAIAVALTSFHDMEVLQVFTRAIEDLHLRSLRSAIVFALGQWDHEQAVPLLLTALSDMDWQVRWRAAEALAKHDDTRAIRPLLVALKDENILVRCQAIEALGTIGDEDVVDPLLKQFSDKESQVRIAAANALTSFHQNVVVEVFLNALEKDQGKEVHHQIINAFGKWRETRAINPLVTALKEPQKNLDERIRLVQALAQIYDDEFLLAFVQAIINHQGDADAYISLPDGKLMKWYQAVDIAIEHILQDIDKK